MIAATARASWMACRTPNPRARVRLFGFPDAGTGASLFRAWSDLFWHRTQQLLLEVLSRGLRGDG